MKLKLHDSRDTRRMGLLNDENFPGVRLLGLEDFEEAELPVVVGRLLPLPSPWLSEVLRGIGFVGHCDDATRVSPFKRLLASEDTE